jgi:hypothetical protein
MELKRQSAGNFPVDFVEYFYISPVYAPADGPISFYRPPCKGFLHSLPYSYPMVKLFIKEKPPLKGK